MYLAWWTTSSCLYIRYAKAVWCCTLTSRLVSVPQYAVCSSSRDYLISSLVASYTCYNLLVANLIPMCIINWLAQCFGYICCLNIDSNHWYIYYTSICLLWSPLTSLHTYQLYTWISITLSDLFWSIVYFLSALSKLDLYWNIHWWMTFQRKYAKNKFY